jgi:putative aldouronate transport system substrate-binding protein
VVTGVTGVAAGNLGAQMQTWTISARGAIPDFRLIAANPPVLNRGDHIVQTIENPFTGLGGHAISTQNQHIEISARFLDWGYGPEGHIFQNFGTEGVSFNWINGQPIYTDYLLNHPGGQSRAQIFSAHTRASWNGPMIQDRRYEDQFLDLPEQVAAKNIWLQPDPFRNMMPPVTPTQEESREFAQIMQAINTYANEMISRFIIGIEPLENFDSYVDQINRMGMPRALEIQAAALKRFRHR